jgi:8-oxo-dGTP pyrophosphatase MutT (NUDIX family)
MAVIDLIKEKLKSYIPRSIECPGDIRASVVLPIFQKDGEAHVVLTRRTVKVKAHPGEISLPGGMFEQKDGTTRTTALRETCEEIGVRGRDIEIVGQLDDMRTLTGFVITPYVGIIPYPYEFKISTAEVAYLIFLPLAYVQKADPSIEEAAHQGKVERVQAIYYNNERIWGATCRILLNFRQVLVDGKVQS